MRVLLLAALSAIGACGSRGAAPERIAVPAEGLVLTIYGSGDRGYAVVDDRRWVDVRGGAIVLDRVEPAAALPSLMIEPLGAGAFRLGTCVRERIDATGEGLAAFAQAAGARSRRGRAGDVPGDPGRSRAPRQAEPIPLGPGVLSPLVRCRVDAPPGRHLVRVLHVTDALRYRVQHELTLGTAERATVSTRFELATPAWRVPAQVTLFDGLPGDETPPRELVRGTVVLDGGTSLLAPPVREVGARQRHVWHGVKLDIERAPSDLEWGKQSRSTVHLSLELDPPPLVAGPIHVVIPDGARPTRAYEVPARARRVVGELVRFPLAVAAELRGQRRRTIEAADGVMIVERVELAVSNTGSEPRVVLVEEQLRPVRRRTLLRSWPGEAVRAGDYLRLELVVAPGATMRAGFTIRYAL